MSETNFKDFTEDEFQKYFINTLRSEGTSPTDIYGRQLADRELLNLTNPNKNATGGKGLDPFTQAVAGTVANRAIDYMINPKVSETTTTQSTPSQIPQMPQQYDTSPYRALDILGAGIARRPTQESYFNQLEKMQNARLEDAYNRRTDTDEAKNLQGLVKQTFPNLSDDIVSKISPDYFSKNYPLLAQMAEKKDIMNAQIKNDQDAQSLIQSYFPDLSPDQIKSVNSKNVNFIYDKLSKEQIIKDQREEKKLQEEKAFQTKMQSDQDARENWRALFPNSTEAQLNTINAKNFDARLAFEDKKSFEREKMAEEKRRKEENASLVRALSKSAPSGEKEKPTDKKFKSDVLDHFDSIAQLETAKNYVNKLNRSRYGALIPDYNYTTKATSSTLDALAQPQIKALAGPGAITESERTSFTPLVITSKDPQEQALMKFNNLMSNSISNGIKKIDNAYSVGTISDNDYKTFLTKYMELAKKHGVQIQK